MYFKINLISTPEISFAILSDTIYIRDTNKILFQSGMNTFLPQKVKEV